MTEAEWLACDDPDRLLAYLCAQGHGTERKLRLVAVACCQRAKHLFRARPSQVAIEVSERHADGEAGSDELAAAATAAEAPMDSGWWRSRLMGITLQANSWETRAATVATVVAGESFGVGELNSVMHELPLIIKLNPHSLESWFGWGKARKAHVNLLRCVFGRYRPQTMSLPRNATCIAIAQAIYEERAFDRLPILGDALEDAGCTNADILDHCRSSGPHVRGCWVVDLVLGRK